jgi:histidyl-tRNA synthetase
MTNASNYKFNKKDRNQKASNERFAFVNANCNNYHLDIESINLALDIFYALGMEEVELKIYKNKLETKEFKEIKKALDDFNIEYTVSKNNLESIYDGLQYEFIYNKTLVAKGGRHNYLVKSLQAPEIPSSSLEFDIDEIKNIIEFTSLTPPLEEELDFLIVTVDSDYDMSLKVASRLRELGVKVDIMYNEYNLNRLRDFIDRLNIPYTIIISHNDAIKGIVRVRNSISKEEGDVYFEDFMEQLIDESKHHHDE